MATDAELRAAGIHLPTGSDYISEGDDAISANARVLWDKIEDGPQYRGNLDEQTGTLATLRDGTYRVRYTSTAEEWGLPQSLIGIVRVTTADSQKTITYAPNDAGAGWGVKSDWIIATNSDGVLRDRWQRADKAIMRTAPVVLTAPAGDYPQTDTRGAVRLPFTVPTNVSRVRVHMRPWNYRTGKQWGPAVLDGVMIAQQNSEGSGTITGSRWYAPNVTGQTVSGATGWTSEWFNVGLAPGNTFLLSYAATWQDDVRDLVLGTCWSNFDLAKWDSTEDAIYQTGWGGFGLQPMDVWIECEAPGDVPVWGYFGASNTMGMDSGDAVFGAYPTVHARRNGAFCALTAAGGWSIMDDTAHNLDIMRRFGYPARILDRAYLDWGSNIAIRGATAQDAIAQLERWMTVHLPALGNPDVHLLTQIAAPDATDTTDTVGTLSDWNEWTRYTATLRPEVKALHDVAAMFADPERPWTARPELRASAGNVHFNRAGQALRAVALDGEVHLPTSTARNADEMSPGRVAFGWSGTPHASESIKYVGGREVARNRAVNPSFEASASDGLYLGSEVTAGNRTSVPERVSQGTYSGILSWAGDESSHENRGLVQQETDVLPGQWVAVSVDLTTTSLGVLYAAGTISERGDSNNHLRHHHLGEYAQAGQHVMTTFTYAVQMTNADVRKVRAGLRFSSTPGTYSLPDAWGYIDGFHIAVADTEAEARKQVSEYFDGDTVGWDRLDRLEGRTLALETEPAPAWADLTGKPATYPPTTHTHEITDVDGLQATIDRLTVGTGWRAVDWLPEGHTVSGSHVLRQGSQVTLIIDVVLSSAGGVSRAAAIPPGFRPTAPSLGGGQSALLTSSTSSTPAALLYINASGSVYLRSVVDGERARQSLTWQTTNDWPTTLPGDPA